jgi:hypothetical protein
VQRRHNCSPAASFTNCVMTLYLLNVHLQTFLSIPITPKCQILSCDTLVANERYVDTAFFTQSDTKINILTSGTHYAEHSMYILSAYLCQATFINITTRRRQLDLPDTKFTYKAIICAICWYIKKLHFCNTISQDSQIFQKSGSRLQVLEIRSVA